MIKLRSFTYLCMNLQDYHNLVSHHEEKTPSNYPKKSELVPHNNFQPFMKHNKIFLQINPPQTSQHVDSQVDSLKKLHINFENVIENSPLYLIPSIPSC